MKKISPFRGVTREPRRKRWRAKCSAIPEFRRLFATEMEAVAHYTAVAFNQWPDQKSCEELQCFNSPWKGRPDPPVAWLDQDKRLRVIDIDHHHCAQVDEPDYIELKDFLWFMRDGHAIAIRDCCFDPEWDDWTFEYLTMEEVIMGFRCWHINGDSLDNRRRNLKVGAGPFPGSA